MDTLAACLITGVAAILASSGFWTFIVKKSSKHSAETKMILGLGHDRIISLGVTYIDRGWVTEDELENLVDYLYEPYAQLGGNGSAKTIVEKVKTLEIRKP